MRDMSEQEMATVEGGWGLWDWFVAAVQLVEDMVIREINDITYPFEPFPEN